MTVKERTAKWRADAAVFREYGDTLRAELLEELAGQIEADLATELLSPAEAQERGLCHAETVRRRVRRGELENMGGPTDVLVRVDALKPTGRKRQKRASGAKRSGAPMVDIRSAALRSRSGR